MDEEPLGGQPMPRAADDQPPPLQAPAEAELRAAAAQPEPAPEAATGPATEPPMDLAPPPALSPTPPTAPPAPPPFTVRLLIRDTFARYAADWLRLLIVSGAVGAITLVVSLFQVSRGLAAFPREVGTFIALALFELIVGLISTSVLFSLMGGGRQTPLRTAVIRGFRRSPSVFLVILAIGAAFLGLGFVTLFATTLLAGVLRSTFIGLVLAVFSLLWVYWFVFRLTLAIPGVVIDRLGVGEALSRSRTITRPRPVWLRMIGSAILLGLLIGAAGFSVALVSFSGSSLVQLVISVVSAAFIAPFSVALAVSIYRRLVPVAGGETPADREQVGFATPEFGRPARRLLGATIVLAVVGAVTFPFAIQAMFDRFGQVFAGFGPNGIAPGRVVPGTITFGSAVTPAQCAVSSPKSTFARTESFTWVAALPILTSRGDKVQLRVSRDGGLLGVIDEPAGIYICMYPTERESGFLPGVYLYEMLVNDVVQASGTVTIT